MKAPSNPKRASVTEIGGLAINSTFANSKFFQKRINRAAIKIQAILRAFLVQARIFRQRKLEPRLQDIQDCENRKLEELRRIEEQKNTEIENLPTRVKAEFEDAEEFIKILKKEIAEYEEVNAELKREHKEVKKKNKELEKEAADHNRAHFKLEVSNNKLANENKDLSETAEKYKYAVEGGNEQKAELEQSLLGEAKTKQMVKRCINRVLKAVEARAEGVDETERPRSTSPTRATAGRHKARRATTKAKSIRGSASFDWTAHQSYDWTKNPVSIEEGGDSLGDLGDLEEEIDKAGGSSGDLVKNGSIGHMSFLFDGAPHVEESVSSDIGTKKKKQKEKNKCNGSSMTSIGSIGSISGVGSIGSIDSGEEGAEFDWATQSYNWANKSIDLQGKKLEAAPKARRQRRNTSALGSGKKSISADSSLGNSVKSKTSKGDKELRELFQELKEIKKELKL